MLGSWKGSVRVSELLSSLLVIAAILVLACNGAETQPQQNTAKSYQLLSEGQEQGSFSQMEISGADAGVDGGETTVTLRDGRIKGSLAVKFVGWLQDAKDGKVGTKNLQVLETDAQGSLLDKWYLHDARPLGWTMSPLDGKGNDVLTEEIVFCIEWFEEARLRPRRSVRVASMGR